MSNRLPKDLRKFRMVCKMMGFQWQAGTNLSSPFGGTIPNGFNIQYSQNDRRYDYNVSSFLDVYKHAMSQYRSMNRMLFPYETFERLKWDRYMLTRFPNSDQKCQRYGEIRNRLLGDNLLSFRDL